MKGHRFGIGYKEGTVLTKISFCDMQMPVADAAITISCLKDDGRLIVCGDHLQAYFLLHRSGVFLPCFVIDLRLSLLL
jgi:hypothetical protein